MHDPSALPAPLAELGDEYELLGELGRGGSAVVYRARDRGLGRDVAIKVVHPRPASPSDDPVARLAREARTVAQLQHPHIVTVHAVRRLRGGGLALVMQYVPGSTLKATIQHEGALAPDRCERVLRDVALALAYAHARGIVHRDVKPENIFLDAETGRALLADFGIARTDEHESMTLTGTAIGTPFYMSPEQVEGAPLDGRSDLYSLGLVAWEMLTARRPWDGESLYNVIYKQKHEELPPIEALRPGVPRRLQYLVERMLQKRPAARWAGADGLLAQLGHSVLPADFARWQSALPGRIARHGLALAARQIPSPPVGPPTAAVSGGATSPSIGAATMEFARTSVGPPPSAELGLADTLTLALDGAPVPPPPLAPLATSAAAAVAGVLRTPGDDARRDDLSAEPLPTRSTLAYHDAVEPTWGEPDERSSTPDVSSMRPARRLLTPATAVAALMLAVAAWHQWSPVTPRAHVQSGPQNGADARVVPAASAAIRTAGLARGASALAASGDAAGAAASPETGDHGRDVLAAGGRHACAVTYGWTIYCWGENERGQLGDGTVVGRAAVAPAATSLALVQVSAGEAHTCAVTRLGDVYCWGDDQYGQLGDATTIRRTAPVRVAGPGVYRAVRAGGRHSCAVTVDDQVACWGANDQGQLGDAGTAARDVPTLVRFSDAARIQAIAVGQLHSCALDREGSAWCWGANGSGQLGDGTTASKRTPARVATDTRFVALAAGNRHSCGLGVGGTIHCWGQSDDGQLGAVVRARAVPRPVAVRLPGGARATQLTAGASHSCAAGPGGESWCWGWNAHGQLGDGTRVDRPVPTPVRTPERITALSAGNRHTCGVTADGRVFCWGTNAGGQLGDGSRASRPAPVRVDLDATLVATPLVRR